MVVNIENLVKRYGNTIALDHLSLQIQEGEIFGLLGPNGSGKTTTINCILSLLTYDRGSIELFGEKMSPTNYNIKKRIGVVMQDVAVFQELNVEDNIRYFCGLYIKDRTLLKQYVEEALIFTGLTTYRKYVPKKLSGGMLRRLNIACGIAHKPEFIIFDEPTVGVDPQSRNMILEHIKELNQKGTTIIYTSHYMEEVEQLCSRIAIMDKGRIIAKGTKEELKSMISIGEKLVFEVYQITDKQLNDIQNIPHISSVTREDNQVTVLSKSSQTPLLEILNYLIDSQIEYRKIHSQLPTLNDVFLELTGKTLRD